MNNKKLLSVLFVLVLVFPLLHSQTPEKQKKVEPAQVEQFKTPLLMPDLTVSFSARRMAAVQPLRQEAGKGVRAVVKNIGKAEAKNFYVDFFISTDQRIGQDFTSYYPPFREDVFLREGRKHIKSLGPGKSITIPAPAPIKIDRKPQLKSYYLGCIADFANNVKEINEANNYAWYKIKDLIAFFKANISSVGQLGIMHEASVGQMCLTLSGSGYGPPFTNKNVYLGSNALAIQDMESSSTWVQAVITPNITFGVTYNVYYAENGVRISNIKQHLLKVYIETVGRVVGSNIELEGPAGCTVKIWGAYYGSAQGSYVIRFGSTAATVLNWTNTCVDIVCPSLPPGYYPIYFEKNGQDVTMSHGGFTIQ